MTRLKFLIILLVFALFYAAYYWAVPAVVDIKNRVPLVQKIIKNEFGADISIENPNFKMGLSPSIWVDASYFAINDGKSSPLYIIKPKLKLRLLPLLFGKIHLAYFSCEKIDAKIKFDKDYRLYIGDYLFVKASNPKLSLEDVKMNIDGYNISVKDDAQKKDIILSGYFFDLLKYNSKKHVKFATNSKLKINDKVSMMNADVDFKLPFKKSFESDEIIFDGTLTNLDFADLSPYINKLTKGEIKQITGLLNIEAYTKPAGFRTKKISTKMAVDNFSLKGKKPDDVISFKDKLNIETSIDFSKNNLNIEKFNLISGKIDLETNGKISNTSAKYPHLDLKVEVKNSRIEDFLALIPASTTPDIKDVNFAALKKYGYWGDIKAKLQIKGNYDKPLIRGNVISENGYVIKPLPAPTPKATVKLDFLGNKMNMDILVPTSEKEKVSVKGWAELYGKKESYLDISSTQNVDLETTSSVLNPLHEIFNFDIGPVPVMQLEGLGNIKLITKGTKEKPHLYGAFNFRNTTASFNGINMKLKNGEGSLYFQDENTHFVTRKAFLDSKPVKVDGKCSLQGILDFDVTANGQELEYLAEILQTSPMLEDVKKSLPSMKNIEGKIDAKIKLSGRVKKIEEFVLGKTVKLSGDVKLLGNNIFFSDLNIPIKNLFGKIKFKEKDADFELYSLTDKSKIRIEGKAINGVLYSKVKLDDIAFSYGEIPVKIFSGNLEIKNDRLTLYKVNALLDSMPILADGTVNDIFKTPKFNIYINSKPSQAFIEKYINKKITYPLKIKGDIIYSSRISGTKDSFNAKTEIDLEENSNIYYMGSTLGDSENPIRIYLDANVNKNIITVNNFQYDKLISSQNSKEFVSQQLNAKGQIEISKEDINLRFFRVRTQNPTDAKVFNIIFKKPLIKQGQFNSNIIINNSITSPKILGQLNFNGVDIPLLDTTIKDISLDFTPGNIDIKAKGDVFSNRVVILAQMENKFRAPYALKNVDVHLGNLDINEIAKSINKLQIETDMNKFVEQKQQKSFSNITDLIIKNARVKADSVFVKNIFAKDFTADFSLNEKLLFSLENFKFDIAQGKVSGNFNYNLLNSKTALNMNVENVNANAISEALFDLKDQIFGSLTGEVDLTCNGKSHKTCMNTLSGVGGFRVAEGKMPKLGSLEYLLKAANLVKSGITGISLNSIVDMLTPLKTGQFENINGTFNINSGVSDSIQIFSKGKDLSLFLTGTYNFSTLNADMRVFGRISKKISTALGPVGNASLNSLFNTIPGINMDSNNSAEFLKGLNKIPGFEFDDKKYRIFSAEIYGDINGDNYVQSFKWVE